ncbi:NAD(P)-dependent oxidoreductase [Blastopirellula retiformator]|uniref:Uncharacterized protein n=1 Tax=Blastopirellula retiformator TaxID=2527970 RepID=A0A5C5US51_9BACT|nr:NAD(P)-dependent oxidoreductase [Blastopirellula retiformator]TWT29291.1 hypothetical protein Enr8_50920 [Blastopirellula retiformator]
MTLETNLSDNRPLVLVTGGAGLIGRRLLRNLTAC